MLRVASATSALRERGDEHENLRTRTNKGDPESSPPAGRRKVPVGVERRAGVLRFATAAPRPSTGADRAAASLGLDLLVAAPTPAPVRERHRDALYAARCAVGDDLAPPRLGPEPALDYAPALRAIFGGEAAREATFAGRRFTHYLRDARHSASALAFAYAAGDLSCPPSSH